MAGERIVPGSPGRTFGVHATQGRKKKKSGAKTIENEGGGKPLLLRKRSLAVKQGNERSGMGTPGWKKGTTRRWCFFPRAGCVRRGEKIAKERKSRLPDCSARGGEASKSRAKSEEGFRWGPGSAISRVGNLGGRSACKVHLAPFGRT